jgi:hypothetical protein
MTYRALRINQKPAPQAEVPKGAFDCDSCAGTGSGGMGVGCTDCLGTGIDPDRAKDGCCHKTVVERCEGCPYGVASTSTENVPEALKGAFLEAVEAMEHVAMRILNDWKASDRSMKDAESKLHRAQQLRNYLNGHK